MNNELKDFFIRNGGKEYENFVEIYLDNYYFTLDINGFSFWRTDTEEGIDIKDISIDRLKALIYGLTGKNLD